MGQEAGSQKLLQLPPSFHGLQHGDLVGVLDVAFRPGCPSQCASLSRRRASVAATDKQQWLRLRPWGWWPRMTSSTLPASTRAIRLAMRNCSGPYAVQGRERIRAARGKNAVEVLGFFDGGDVGGLFHYAHQALVAGCAGAIDAWSTSVMLLQTEQGAGWPSHRAPPRPNASASSSLARRM